MTCGSRPASSQPPAAADRLLCAQARPVIIRRVALLAPVAVSVRTSGAVLLDQVSPGHGPLPS